MPAKYSLVDVKMYAKMALTNPQANKVFFSMPPKSIRAVVEAFRRKGSPITLEQAQEYICNGILDLTSDDFCKQIAGQYSNPTLIVDHYGLKKDDIPWFIKFFIDSEDPEDIFLDEVSFHPTDRDMLLENSKTIPVDRKYL